ncbi:DUF6893 family small protein [Streptomyces sp. NPDC059740]
MLKYVLCGAAAAGVAAAVVQMLPDIRRYLRIRAM